jgi:hypothetical protein
VPDTITLLRRPPCAPELVPVANVWHVMRGNGLGDRVFAPTTTSSIWAACREAPDRPPWKIMSLGLRIRAYRS